MPLRLKRVARSLSGRAEFLGLELEDWGFVIAWAIVIRLIGDHVHRVFLGFVPVSTVMTYGSVNQARVCRLPPVLQGKPVRNPLAFDATFAQQSTEVVENLVRED